MLMAFVAHFLATAGPSYAQNMRSLKESLIGKDAQDGREQSFPKRAQFISQGGVGFVVDTTRDKESVLIRFDGHSEIFALSAYHGPKGDIIFKNDVGEPVLKSTRWGGMTLFTPNMPSGEAVATVRPIENFEPEEISPRALLSFLTRSSIRASHAAQSVIKSPHRISFDAQIDADIDRKGDEYLFADAAFVTTEAIISVSHHRRGADILRNVEKIELFEGRPPSVTLKDGVLRLKLDTQRGIWGGRPSSKRISQVLIGGIGNAPPSNAPHQPKPSPHQSFVTAKRP